MPCRNYPLSGVTGTGSMFKRIFFGYLAVLLISFAVLAIAFSFTVRQYLINDTVNSLYRVAETLSANPMPQGMHGSGHMRGAFFNLANRIAYADYLVLTADGSIIDSSDRETYPLGVKNINEAFDELAFNNSTEKTMVKRDLVAVAFPVKVSDSGENASLILYSQLEVLTQLNRSLLGILALALGAGIIVSILAGTFATRVVVGPLQLLKRRANELAARKFTGRLEISTGDEVEELAETFNEMADRLADYDLNQREFFQRASHELKTPLMSVQGYAEALKENVIPDDERSQSLDIIIKESKRMKALVEEFILLSKMETVQESYRFEPLSLENAVREAVYAVQSLALEKKISIEISCDQDGALEVQGDPEKIHRLLLNVLGNALRSASKQVSVSVGAGYIKVEDDGPGFDPGNLEKVFSPFYSGQKEGSGLGLAISRAIVENHGGTIDAVNKPGGGAVIIISIPLDLTQNG